MIQITTRRPLSVLLEQKVKLHKGTNSWFVSLSLSISLFCPCLSGCLSPLLSVKVGDRISKVNGQSVTGMTRDEVVALLRSSEGKIDLVISHNPLSPGRATPGSGSTKR